MATEFFSAAHMTLLLAAVLGTFMHWVKMRWKQETLAGPILYLVSHPWSTFSMFGATAIACGAIITTGVLASMTLPVIFWMGLGTGYTLDSAVNKGPDPAGMKAPSNTPHDGSD